MIGLDDQREARESRTRPVRKTERLVVLLKPSNVGGGKGPHFQTSTYDAANQQLTAADERQRKRVGCRCLVAKPPRDSDYCQVS